MHKRDNLKNNIFQVELNQELEIVIFINTMPNEISNNSLQRKNCVE